MEVFGSDDLPIVFEVPDAEIRSTDVGGMTVSFYRLPAGDLRPILEGLPDDACPCPHWGYVVSGRLRLHTGTETRDVEAGQGYYVGPGHTAETIEPTEVFEVSPTPQSLEVWEHFKAKLLQA